MKAWSKDELHNIAEADDLHISPLREDGRTYGTPTWIWSVAVDDALYVRGYNGQRSRWYQSAVHQKAGRIIAAWLTKEVAFEAVEGPLNDRIDDAYRAKYQNLAPLISLCRRVQKSRSLSVIPIPIQRWNFHGSHLCYRQHGRARPRSGTSID